MLRLRIGTLSFADKDAKLADKDAELAALKCILAEKERQR